MNKVSKYHVKSMISLQSDNFFMMEVDHLKNEDTVISYKGENYQIKSRVSELNDIWVLILYKISTHENKDKDPKIPDYEQGYCQCPSCGYFDVFPDMDSCPKCDQKFIWK